MSTRKSMVLIRDFQFRYAGAAVGVGVLSTVISAVLILYPLYTFEILRIPKFLPMPILISMVVAALLNITLIGLIGVYVTHSIAGPMYSVVREFRRVESGDWTSTMRQRKNDDLRYLVRNYNAMMDSLRNQGKYESDEVIKLKNTVEKINDPSKEEALEIIDTMNARWSERLEVPKES